MACGGQSAGSGRTKIPKTPPIILPDPFFRRISTKIRNGPRGREGTFRIHCEYRRESGKRRFFWGVFRFRVLSERVGPRPSHQPPPAHHTPSPSRRWPPSHRLARPPASPVVIPSRPTRRRARRAFKLAPHPGRPNRRKGHRTLCDDHSFIWESGSSVPGCPIRPGASNRTRTRREMQTS